MRQIDFVEEWHSTSDRDPREVLVAITHDELAGLASMVHLAVEGADWEFHSLVGPAAAEALRVEIVQVLRAVPGSP